jgi:hypothetical protein
LAYIAGYPYYLKKDISFRTQPDYPEPDSPGINEDILIYIEIWLKTINYIDDDFIREPILSGPDTCLRAKLVGQVKVVSAKKIENCENAGALLLNLFPENRLSLSMKIDHSGRQIPLSFGEIEAGGGYSVQNLHLRLELHRGISLKGGFSEGLKWSDENCATVARIQKILAPDSALVEEPEAVSGSFLSDGDWIEIDNLVTELHRQGGQIAQIKKISQEDSGYKIELDSEIHPLLTRHSIGTKPGMKIELEPRLRRWSGYMTPIIPEKPVNLGKGIKAIFHAPEKNFSLIPGDFWTFALRDRDYNKKYAPVKASPDGVKVYRYPLAIIRKTGKDRYGNIIDCRKFFKPLT